MKDERHEMKKLVLAYEQRQEEEDYSGNSGVKNSVTHGLIQEFTTSGVIA